MLKHVPDRNVSEYVLKHVPKHVLRNMPDKQGLEHVTRHIHKHVLN